MKSRAPSKKKADVRVNKTASGRKREVEAAPKKAVGADKRKVKGKKDKLERRKEFVAKALEEQKKRKYAAEYGEALGGLESQLGGVLEDIDANLTMAELQSQLKDVQKRLGKENLTQKEQLKVEALGMQLLFQRWNDHVNVRPDVGAWVIKKLEADAKERDILLDTRAKLLDRQSMLSQSQR